MDEQHCLTDFCHSSGADVRDSASVSVGQRRGGKDPCGQRAVKTDVELQFSRG